MDSIGNTPSNKPSSNLIEAGGFKISIAAKVIFATLLTLSLGATIASAVLFFHMAIPIAFLALIISSAVSGFFLIALSYKAIERALPLPLRFPVDLVTSIAKEFFFVPILLAIMAGQGIFGKKKETSTGAGEVVLMVHGYFGTSAHFAYLKYRLEKPQVGSLYTLDLGNPLLSIDAYAQKVAAEVQRIQGENPGKKIHLVGHSMGGVVISRYVADCANTNHIEQVITLGSPLRGVVAAAMMPGKCAREMQHGSNYLQNLENDLQNKAGLFVNVGSTTDLIIVPNNSTSFKNLQTDRVKLPGMGHASYLFSDQVAGVLAQKIRGQ
jgi:hypothetical protein